MCSKHYDSRKQPIPRLVLAATVLTICVLSCTSFEHLTQVSNAFPHAKDCGKCHVDVYREWSQSDHAGAYINPHFQAATNDYAFEDCLNCHAPEPMLTTDTPALRSSLREEGVTCVSCHLEAGELCGPLEPTGKVHPHPIGVRPEIYGGVGICGRCHQDTMKQWDAAEAEKNTCQECHMEAVTRKVTQATGGMSNILVAMEKEVPQKRHVFRILNGTQAPGLIALTTTRTDSRLELRVENHLPHDLPTGSFGFRVLTLEIFAVDANHETTPIKTWELAGELGTAVPPQGVQAWTLDLTGDVKAVRAILTRRSYDGQALVLAQNEVGG